jgi:hypothetical protein
MEERVTEAHRYGLIRDLAKVIQLSTMLKEKGRELTVGDCYARARHRIPTDIQHVLQALRREGIRIPLPSGSKQAKERALVVDRLVHAAADFTFKQYYTVATRHVPRATRHALAFASLHALLGWGTNDRCCDHDKFTKLDYCRPKADSSCYLATDPRPMEKNGILYGFCTDASDHC